MKVKIQEENCLTPRHVLTDHRKIIGTTQLKQYKFSVVLSRVNFNLVKKGMHENKNKT